jgi:hypothetical protein
MKNLIAIAISASLLIIPHDLLADGHDNFEDEPTAPSASSKRNVSLPDDAPFQRACNASINMRDWESSEVCGCAGQYTSAKPSGGVSAKDLANNPHWVKQPDAYSYNDMVQLNKKSGTMIEWDSATRLADGRWSCRASFFGYVLGNGDLTLSWRGRFIPHPLGDEVADKPNNIMMSPHQLFEKGNRYRTGIDDSLFSEGQRLICRAAALDHPTALKTCGDYHWLGHHVPMNKSKGIQLWKKAALAGVTGVAADVGYKYWLGKGVPQDYRAALKWFRLAVQQGDFDSHRMVTDLEKKIASEKAAPPIFAGKPPEPTAGPKQQEAAPEVKNDGSVSKRLKALKKLLEEGLITKEEAAVKRKEILKNL